MEKMFFACQVPGFGKKSMEFFIMNGVLQFIQDDRVYLFDEITIDVLDALRKEMDSDVNAIRGIELLGITDPVEQIRKYVACRYGKLDTTPDVTEDGSTTEYWDCGCHAVCPADGLLCRFPAVAEGRLTRHDVQVIREIATDVPNKQIADHFNRSVDTINKESQMICHKIGCFTRSGIAHFAGINGI